MTFKEAKKRLTPKVLEHLRRIKDADIDYSEIPELDAQFWRKARPLRGRPKKAVCKDMVNIRLDHFAVMALRNSGKGWQTRVSDYISEGIRAGVLQRGV
jgi:uncharacterized protein (DUF4415 family)